MNLSDELKKMRNKGRYVVSIDYVLDRLRLIESENKAKIDQLLNNQTKRFKRQIRKPRKDVIEWTPKDSINFAR